MADAYVRCGPAARPRDASGGAHADALAGLAQRSESPTPGVAIGPFYSDTLPFYGKIEAGQDVAVGAYADTLTITVEY